MREVKFLSQDHLPGLVRLLEAQGTAHSEYLKRNAQYFIAGGGEAHAVGLVEDRANVALALLVLFQRPTAHHDYLAVTTVVSADATVNFAPFNSLCAACSSATPTVVCHLVICKRELKAATAKAWQASRLGKFTADSRELTTEEANELVWPVITLDSTQSATMYSIRYPSEASLQPGKGSDTIRRCKYC